MTVLTFVIQQLKESSAGNFKPLCASLRWIVNVQIVMAAVIVTLRFSFWWHFMTVLVLQCVVVAVVRWHGILLVLGIVIVWGVMTAQTFTLHCWCWWSNSVVICYGQVARQHGIPFLETSAKSNVNVEKGFLDLTQAILDKVLTASPPAGLLCCCVVSRDGNQLKFIWWITHTHLFNGHYSGTTQVGRYQKGKTNLDLTDARDSEWQWHQLGHMQVCTLLQTDDHASTSPLKFFTDWMPFLPPNQQHQTLKAHI